MKLAHVDFEEWADRDVDFIDSDIYIYFSEHSFLCPIFCERNKSNAAETTFEGFKRFAFDDEFIEKEVHRMWKDSRALIHQNKLVMEIYYDKLGNPVRNNSGEIKSAPNLPKSSEYDVFFRGGANNSSESAKTEVVNNVRMIPQFFWLKGSYISKKLATLQYL